MQGGRRGTKKKKRERKYKFYNTYNRVGMVWEWTDMKLRHGVGHGGWGAAEPPHSFLSDVVSTVARLRSPLRRWGQEERVRASVGPPAVAVVGRLVALGLLRDGAGLATLPAARLAILLQVVVKDLGVRLLMGGQDVHKGGRWIGSSCGRIDGPPTP